jgi:hypothetical protein
MRFTAQDIISYLKYLETDTTTAILLGGGSVFLYLLWRGYKKGAGALDWGDTIAVFLATFSILGGLRVIIFGLENRNHFMDSTQQTYIVIGGGAVIWHGCKTLRKKLLEA